MAAPRAAALGKRWRPSARAIVVHDGRLWVGVDGGRAGKAALFAYKHGSWSQLGGGSSGWAHGQEVHTLCAHGGMLYAGVSSAKLGAQLWRTQSGDEWERVGAWPDRFTVSALCTHQDRLYVGLIGGKTDTEANIVAYDGRWHDVGSESTWGHRYIGAYDMCVHDGELYAGFVAHGWFGGHVWRLSGEPELVAGDGRRGSWRRNSTVLRLRSIGGKLVAIMNREPQGPGNFSNIWACDGETWAPLLALPTACKQLYSFNALVAYRGKLVVGAGGRPAGRASVFCLDGKAWYQIGGKGINDSWSPRVYRDQFAPLSNRWAAEYVYQFCEYEGDLIVGFGASQGCAQIWRFSSEL